MSPTRQLRAAVEQAGGRLDMTVRELRDAFGVSRLTTVARQRITDDLRKAKLRTEPPLVQCQLDDPIAVIDNRRSANRRRATSSAQADDPWKAANARFADGPAKPTDSAGSPASMPPGPSAPIPGNAGNRSNEPWYRRRGVLVTGAVVLAVLLIAGIFGSSDEDQPPVSAGSQGASAAQGAEYQDRAEALALVGRANAAIADDDPRGARALLAEIDSTLLEHDADLSGRVDRSFRLARLTDRYLDAQDLADSGALILARKRMLAIVPFRKSGALAERFGTQAAEDLVAQAEDVYETRPGRALNLLNRAEDLAPDLGAIDDVRSLAVEQQEALAAPPPAPTPAPAAVSSCDPNYSGACIPNVPYDLNCDDVAAVNFASVGSDPHGFDREGDGLACEG